MWLENSIIARCMKQCERKKNRPLEKESNWKNPSPVLFQTAFVFYYLLLKLRVTSSRVRGFGFISWVWWALDLGPDESDSPLRGWFETFFLFVCFRRSSFPYYPISMYCVVVFHIPSVPFSRLSNWGKAIIIVTNNEGQDLINNRRNVSSVKFRNSRNLTNNCIEFVVPQILTLEREARVGCCSTGKHLRRFLFVSSNRDYTSKHFPSKLDSYKESK